MDDAILVNIFDNVGLIDQGSKGPQVAATYGPVKRTQGGRGGSEVQPPLPDGPQP